MSATDIERRSADWVEESAFGKWFLRTKTWEINVLNRALNDLERLMAPKRDRYPVILDVGCGYGHALPMLDERFNPDEIIGLEVDPQVAWSASAKAETCRCRFRLLIGNAASVDLPDQCVDLLFCHQTFHHIVDQESAIREFYRVLKPGAVLLFAESCRRYIHSFLIRVLFRHPMDVQKTDVEYIELIERAGFTVRPDAVSRPFLWWSRQDLGLLEKLGYGEPEGEREETLVNLIATRPGAASARAEIRNQPAVGQHAEPE